MGLKSKIAWTDHTWNPWTGCSPVSEGCQHCYMERWAERSGRNAQEVKRSSDKVFMFPLNKRVKPGDHVFVCSLSDFFHPGIPDEARDQAFALMAMRDDVRFLLLTKRVGYMHRYMYQLGAGMRNVAGQAGRIAGPIAAAGAAVLLEVGLPNVWLGVTAENQKRAEERLPLLLDIKWPGKRFVSIEPMLGPVDIEPFLPAFVPLSTPDRPGPQPTEYAPGLDWVIVGGESGRGCRPMDLAWAEVLRDHCARERVPFFMKQLGGWPDKRDQLEDLPEDLRVREVPE